MRMLIAGMLVGVGVVFTIDGLHRWVQDVWKEAGGRGDPGHHRGTEATGGGGHG